MPGIAIDRKQLNTKHFSSEESVIEKYGICIGASRMRQSFVHLLIAPNNTPAFLFNLMKKPALGHDIDMSTHYLKMCFVDEK